MGYSLIANVAAGSGDGNTFTSGSIDTSGADLIVVGKMWFGTGEPTLSDSKLSSYTSAHGAANDGSDRFFRMYYVQAPTVGSGHTWTITGAGVFASVFAAAFSGSALNPRDQANLGSGSGTTGQPGNITPTQDNELVVTGLVWDSASASASIDNGYAILNQLDKVSAQHVGGALAYKIQTAAAPTNPTWTLTDSNLMGLGISSFLAAASGPTLGYLRANRLRPRIFGPGLAR